MGMGTWEVDGMRGVVDEKWDETNAEVLIWFITDQFYAKKDLA